MHKNQNLLSEPAGQILDFPGENPVVSGCTVSKQVYNRDNDALFVFSMAPRTEISPESYSYFKLCLVYEGSMEVFCLTDQQWNVQKGQAILLPKDTPVGMKTMDGCIYLEIAMRKESEMNELIQSGKVFELGALLPYQEGKIVNMDLCHNEKMKFALMSFDAGTGLSEHAAPGEALVLALDGEGIIGYEGKEYPIKAGETFKFDKNGRHSVTAVKQFKMALLLVLE